MPVADLTPTQARIMAVLADGYAHIKEELQRHLDDELSCPQNIIMHIANVRKKIRPLGEDIVTELLAGKTYYRWVRLLGNPYR